MFLMILCEKLRMSFKSRLSVETIFVKFESIDQVGLVFKVEKESLSTDTKFISHNQVHSSGKVNWVG